MSMKNDDFRALLNQSPKQHQQQQSAHGRQSRPVQEHNQMRQNLPAAPYPPNQQGYSGPYGGGHYPPPQGSPHGVPYQHQGPHHGSAQGYPPPQMYPGPPQGVHAGGPGPHMPNMHPMFPPGPGGQPQHGPPLQPGIPPSGAAAPHSGTMNIPSVQYPVTQSTFPGAPPGSAAPVLHTQVALASQAQHVASMTIEDRPSAQKNSEDQAAKLNTAKESISKAATATITAAATNAIGGQFIVQENSVHGQSSSSSKITTVKAPVLTPGEEVQWIAFKDSTDGAVYYHNRSTGETTWEKPTGRIVDAEAMGGSSSAGGSVGAPTVVSTDEVGATGWSEVKMSDGSCYFFHKQTRQTTWDVPPEVAKARPGRPQIHISQAGRGGAEPPPPGLSPRPVETAKIRSDLDAAVGAASAASKPPASGA